MVDRAVSSGAPDAVRRAPFGTNPQVGARGQRTRQRILDAALRVFRELGVHHGSVERIAAEAGCSRAAFYQYFADKDDVLRHLAAQLTLHLDAAVAWLEPITPDADGWASLRDLVARWSEVHERHRSVFSAYPAMVEGDADFAADAGQARARFMGAIAARVEGSDLPPAAVDGTVDLFLVTFPRADEDLAILRHAAPASFPLEPTLDAITDIVHRALFGLDPDVNVHEHDLPAPPRLRFGPLVSSGMQQAPPTGGDAATRTAVLAAARACFLRHGYHGTRIDAIAEEAGVSHGTIYTYFQSKDQLAQVLALAAMQAAARTVQRLPDVGDRPVRRAELRDWLAEYNRAQAGETAMIRVWSDSLQEDGHRVEETAPPLDWGRRQLARGLARRGFGDVELEAAVLLAFLSSLGSRDRAPAEIDGAALLIQRGLYGQRGDD